MKVIFRKFKGEIIAFFPETYQHGEITYYTHIGQHGTADIRFYHETKRAFADEYLPLLIELKTVAGYENLEVKARMQYK